MKLKLRVTPPKAQPTSQRCPDYLFMDLGESSFSTSLTGMLYESTLYSLSSSYSWSSSVLAQVPMSQGGSIPPNSEGRMSGCISWCRLFRLLPCKNIYKCKKRHGKNTKGELIQIKYWQGGNEERKCLLKHLSISHTLQNR